MEDVYTIKSSVSGPNLLVMFGVHGNETCGISAFQRLKDNLKIKKGSVTFILGNPEAARRNIRFVEENLNRLFLSEDEIPEGSKDMLEYKRSRELIPYLDSADALLDLHSSSTPESPVFVICEPHSFEFARKLPGKIIVANMDRFEPGSTDHYMNRQNKVGICLECGSHDDHNSIDTAETAIKIFLSHYGVIDSEKIGEEKAVYKVSQCYRTKNKFVVKDRFVDFQKVSEGELIGSDGNDDVRAQENGYILFVRNTEKIGQEAFLMLDLL